jgi:hypothetical protein
MLSQHWGSRRQATHNRVIMTTWKGTDARITLLNHEEESGSPGSSSSSGSFVDGSSSLCSSLGRTGGEYAAVQAISVRQRFCRAFSSSSAAFSLSAIFRRALQSGARTTSSWRTNRRIAAKRRSRSPISCSEPSSEMPLSDSEQLRNFTTLNSCGLR